MPSLVVGPRARRRARDARAKEKEKEKKERNGKVPSAFVISLQKFMPHSVN